MLHKGCGEKRERLYGSCFWVCVLCVRCLGYLAGSSAELCVLLLEVLPCSIYDITCETGVECQASLFTRFGFRGVERDGREGFTRWRMLKD